MLVSRLCQEAPAEQKPGEDSDLHWDAALPYPSPFFSKMQNPLAPPGPEGTYRRLEQRKEAHTKSTHLACLMVADPQVALEAEEDPLLAGRIVLRVRPEPMHRARLD